jgi:hypothetical protein
LPVTSDCSATPKSALVVEGFGSRSETQLIVAERDLGSRCAERVPQGRTATLAAQE